MPEGGDREDEDVGNNDDDDDDADDDDDGNSKDADNDDDDDDRACDEVSAENPKGLNDPTRSDPCGVFLFKFET